MCDGRCNWGIISGVTKPLQGSARGNCHQVFPFSCLKAGIHETWEYCGSSEMFSEKNFILSSCLCLIRSFLTVSQSLVSCLWCSCLNLGKLICVLSLSLVLCVPLILSLSFVTHCVCVCTLQAVTTVRSVTCLVGALFFGKWSHAGSLLMRLEDQPLG